MPNTPQLDGIDVAPSMAPTPGFHPDAPAAAFGGPIGQGLSLVGQDADQAALKMQGIANETNALNTSAAFTASATQLKAKQDTLQGQDFVTAAPGYVASIQALRDQTIAAAPNPEARQMVANDVMRQTNYMINVVGERLPKELIQANTQASTGRIATASSAAAAAPHDANVLQNSVGVVQQETQRQAENNGWDKDYTAAMQQKNMGDLIRPVVSQLIANNQPEAAATIFDQFKGQIDAPSLDRIAEQLQPKLRASQNAAIINGVTQVPGGANLQIPEQYKAPIHAAAVANGIPDNVLAGTIQFESGWDAGAVNKVSGATGLGQVLPSTAANPGFGLAPVDPATMADPVANINETAKYLAARGKAAGVTDWTDAVQGAKGFSAYYSGTPENTARYAQGVSALAYGAKLPVPPSYAAPDREGWLSAGDAAADKIGADETQRAQIAAGINRKYDLWHTQTEADRTALGKALEDTSAALLGGRNDATIPETAIRQLYPWQQAQQLIDKLHDDRDAGTAVQGVKYAAAADVPAYLERLNPGNDATIENYAMRSKEYNLAVSALQSRNTELSNDPARYTMGVPAVQNAFAAMKAAPDDPSVAAAYVSTMKAQQQRLGVPAGVVDVLPKSEAVDLVKQITGLDPKQASVTTTLDSMAQRYGDGWGDVFNSMKRAGLPQLVPTLGTMTEPSQFAARDALQRYMVSTANVNGGAKAIENQVGPVSMKAITAAMDPQTGGALADFDATTALKTNGAQLRTETHSAVSALAQQYLIEGAARDGTAAVNMAVGDIINKKTDIVGTARVPVGQTDTFNAAAGAFTANLKSGDVALPPDNGQYGGLLTYLRGQREDGMLNAAKNGTWVSTGDGVQLLGNFGNGVHLPVFGKDGKPLGFDFKKDMPTLAAGAAISNPGGPSLGVVGAMK